MSIVVKWGRERLHVPLPPPSTKLAVLREYIAESTALPAKSFKLIHAGAVMKDDNAPISAYGLRENSTIAIVGGDQQAPSPAPPSASKKTHAHVRPTQQSTIAQIHSELDSIRQNLVPSLDSFLSSVSVALPAPPVTPQYSTVTAVPITAEQWCNGNSHQTTMADLEQEHVRLGELLLQALLRLDVINLEGEWQDARRERKVAVKEVQGLLDRLDDAWNARASLKSSM
ncbi:hypothetical protein BD410DRAFT_783920 [Rickenella mellea]|uniref:BAG domain-containing protein n=1 Tax=Rickenella mellea TaxID=50990 RepID=A0A4Y7QGF8_9AGAM|nr:hypothetical protein BD410DRAFT_783920 [Rickenella mellea]